MGIAKLRLNKVLAGAAAVLLCTVLSPPASAAPAVRCSDVRIPVTISGAAGQVGGTLCAPPEAKTIQVLVPGFSYTRYYWDFPHQPEKYSYVRHANEAGYATLSLDRVGTGDPLHPPSVLDTFDNNASAVHQAVQAARKGIHGQQFDKVVLTGHSYGSLTVYREAGMYRDVDAVVITGGAHSYNLVNLLTKVVLQSPPALLSEKFANKGYDPGYVVPRPGNRAIFYADGQVDPEVLAKDEQLRQTGTLVELLTVAPYPLLSITKDLNVPTFTINGTKDPFFCGPFIADCSSDEALAASERRFYGPDATVEATIVPGAGHNLNLERTAPTSFDKVTNFVDRHVRA